MLLVLLMFLVRPVQAGILEGRWEGGIQLHGEELAVELNFQYAMDEWSGSISIPAEGANDLPLERIVVLGADASFAIAGVPGVPTFRGTIVEHGDPTGPRAGENTKGAATLSGTFVQGGETFPFTVTSAGDPMSDARTALAGMGQVIEAALENWRTPGLALVVVKGDEVLLLEGYGLRNVEDRLPVTPKTLFAIGSATKAFTTFTLATLVDEGTLDWDVPVAEYIPDFRLHDDYATLHLTPRDLVTHRSGLPRHDLVWYNDETVTRADLVRRLRYLEPNMELREGWQYNNLMFLTAGFLTEVLTGETWEESVRERVLDPLGMERTNFSVHQSAETSDFAEPYVLDDDELRTVDFRPITVMGPAGSLNSCVEEMANWVRVHLSGGSLRERRILSSGTLRELHTPQMIIAGLSDEVGVSPASYAFGWFVQSWHGHLMLHHGGNIDGFSARVTLFPDDELGVVVLTNRNVDALPELVSMEIANRILRVDEADRIGEAEEERDEMQEFTREGQDQADMFRKKGTKTTRPLDQFAGEYSHPGYGTIEVRHEKRALTMVHNGMSLPLAHWHYDVFTVPEQTDEVIPEHLRIVFQTNAEGRIAGFTAPLEPTIDPLFFEREPDRRLLDPSFLARLAGEYEVPGDQVLSVSLQGNVLVGRVSDQPAVEMVPEVLDPDGAQFTIDEVKGLSFRFVFAGNAPASKVLLVQPGGVFELPRRKTNGG